MEDVVIVAASKKVTRLLIFFAFVCVSLVALTSYTKYIYAKDYTFRIESTCNPEEGVCYVRDCDEYCPPNNLAVYTVYNMSASYYDQCENNSCENICHNEDTAQLCIELKCSEENGDVCTD